MKGTHDDSTLLVHKVCNSQLTSIPGSPLICDVCGGPVGIGEMTEADNSPSPFSG
ncbi:MAG TPA: hypothetical protein VJR06_06010 [Nitrososphaerales archaeon]|nr:hypothetical protein [Nitrososphaerales archaeon]